jgi:uncharacterized Rmd1/YagE family protein
MDLDAARPFGRWTIIILIAMEIVLTLFQMWVARMS